MRRFPLPFFILFLLIFGEDASAQRFGGNRPGIRWNQIETDTALVIFPEGLEQRAMEIASLIRTLARETDSSIGSAIRQVPIVLQNQPVVSNGYVGLAPFRSEFYMNPPANNYNLGTLPWHLQLAAHEFRHVQQYNNFKKGLAAALFVFLGEEGQALMNALTIPDWFFEGDAVFQETDVSAQGRGRIPYFFNEFKVLREANVRYSYMRLRNGSYRHLYPDHYNLGYQLAGYGYEKYGKGFWRKVTDDAAGGRGFFYPFQKAVEKHAGIPFGSFVKEAVAYFNAQYPGMVEKEKRTAYVADAVNPQPMNADSIVWLERSYRDLPKFVLSTTNGKQRLKVKPIGSDDYFSQRDGKIVYTRFSVHPRWSWTEYSDIALYDMASRKEIKLTRRQRYFSPDINEEGNKIVAVENKANGESNLVIIDAQNGNLLQTVPFPANWLAEAPGVGVFTYPKFDGDTAILAGLRFSDGRSAMVSISGERVFKLLTPPSFQVLGIPQPGTEYIYTTASLAGEDRILRIRKLTGEAAALEGMQRIYAPVQAGNDLVFTEYTLNGMKPRRQPLNGSVWSPVGEQDLKILPLYLPGMLAHPADITKAVNDSFAVSRYRKTTDFFNFHSWRPFYDQSEWSFTLYGQNVLNTFQTEAAYTYNVNEGSHTLGLAGLYGAWFPYLRGSLDYTTNRTSVNARNNRLNWNEITAAAGVQVPLRFNDGLFYRSLNLSSSFNNQSVYFTGDSRNNRDNLHFNYLRGTIQYSAQIQQARQHIYPRFAYTFSLDYRSVINNYTARQLLTTAALYVPGLHKTHNLIFTGALQNKDSAGDYNFSNGFPYARGFTAANLFRMRKAGVNYHLPLWYPEFGIAQIVYFMRVRANLFYDHSRVSDRFRFSDNVVRYVSFDQRSTGMELFFDTRWWNQLPVSFGVRYSRLLDRNIFGGGRNRYEFIMPVDLF